jgi:citrate synthase
MPENSLTVTDNRNGKTYEIAIQDGTIRAMDLRQIKISEDDFGLMAYDPAFTNTASCRSSITFIDGDKGILEYRGYPIEELAEQSSFIETAYLLLNGELPGKAQLERWSDEVTHHTLVHERIKKFLDGFRYDAHPMGILVSSMASLSTLYPEAKNLRDRGSWDLQFQRLLGKMPTLSACAYRHSRGLPFTYPDNSLSYTGNFLNMMFKMTELRYEPNPVIERALDVLLILHADHEQNCSTNACRSVGSSGTDPFTAVSAAAAALYGPLHGGANEAVIRMLNEIGSVDRVPEFVKEAKDGKRRLMGFGHRVYKNYDPRAKIIKKLAHDVFEATGENPLLDIALELERIALEDDYFVKRKLYPNVDFYSGLIYQSIGFPTEMFTVLFAIGRTAGWLAQWKEMSLDKETKIARPRQIYTGPSRRPYVPLAKRT